jgi:hypothetical protein
LTPEAGNHTISFSPSEDYFVDTWSKPDVPPVSVLRNLQGKVSCHGEDGYFAAGGDGLEAADPFLGEGA